MRPVPSATSSRFLALWFPFLPAERWEIDRRRQAGRLSPSAAPAETGAPAIFVERVKGALRLAALSRQARACGLQPGLTLADARARIPDLTVIEHAPPADADFLERVAEDCDRWTPLVALDGVDGLILDITGCAHLFGGEMTMRKHLLAHLEAHGLSAFAVVAGTPEAARALVRCARSGLVPVGEEATHLAPLSIAALDLPAETVSGLSRAGLKTIGALTERASTPLVARFGETLLVRLRRALGQEASCLVPRRPLPALMAERRFAEPLARTEDIEAVLGTLIADLIAMLEARGQGGRAFEVTLFRTDGVVRRLAIDTARPTRDGAALARLFRERLESLADPLDPGFGFDMARLAVARTEALSPAQIGLDGRANEDEEVAALVDRLATRLGRQRVLRFLIRDTHDPSRASALVPAGEAMPSAQLREEDVPRPLTLFDPPQPVEALAEVPDGPPLKFRWRRVLHEVTRAEGPERLAPEWWHAPFGTEEAQMQREALRTRDYFRVENREGRRFWLFRAGLYERGVDTPRWFLHGLFP